LDAGLVRGTVAVDVEDLDAAAGLPVVRREHRADALERPAAVLHLARRIARLEVVGVGVVDGLEHAGDRAADDDLVVDVLEVSPS
jgi:hypothetical protein